MVESILSILVATFIILLQHYPIPSEAALAVQLERIEQIGGKHLVDSSGARIRKFNRTTFTINGTFALLVDFDETYEASLKVAFSRLGNNQWNVYPMKVAQKTVCQAMVDEYRQYQYVFINYTNLPRVPQNARRFCPFAKGKYWVRDLAPDASWVPPVVPAGYWRMTLESWRRGQLLAEFNVYFKITK